MKCRQRWLWKWLAAHSLHGILAASVAGNVPTFIGSLVHLTVSQLISRSFCSSANASSYLYAIVIGPHFSVNINVINMFISANTVGMSLLSCVGLFLSDLSSLELLELQTISKVLWKTKFRKVSV